MKNIFENAYFGKVYKTRDGKKAIFSHTEYSEEDNETFAYLMIENKGVVSNCSESELNCLLVSLDGTWHAKKYESEDDIVSEWKEPIDKEKLNEAKNEWWQTAKYQSGLGYGDAFDAGYIKAKEE